MLWGHTLFWMRRYVKIRETKTKNNVNVVFFDKIIAKILHPGSKRDLFQTETHETN